MVQGALKTSVYEVKCFCEEENGIETGGQARQGCSALFLVIHFGLECNGETLSLTTFLLKKTSELFFILCFSNDSVYIH